MTHIQVATVSKRRVRLRQKHLSEVHSRAWRAVCPSASMSRNISANWLKAVVSAAQLLLAFVLRARTIRASSRSLPVGRLRYRAVMVSADDACDTLNSVSKLAPSSFRLSCVELRDSGTSRDAPSVEPPGPPRTASIRWRCGVVSPHHKSSSFPWRRPLRAPARRMHFYRKITCWHCESLTEHSSQRESLQRLNSCWCCALPWSRLSARMLTCDSA